MIVPAKPTGRGPQSAAADEDAAEDAVAERIDIVRPAISIHLNPVTADTEPAGPTDILSKKINDTIMKNTRIALKKVQPQLPKSFMTPPQNNSIVYHI